MTINFFFSFRSFFLSPVVVAPFRLHAQVRFRMPANAKCRDAEKEGLCAVPSMDEQGDEWSLEPTRDVLEQSEGALPIKTNKKKQKEDGEDDDEGSKEDASANSGSKSDFDDDGDDNDDDDDGDRSDSSQDDESSNGNTKATSKKMANKKKKKDSPLRKKSAPPVAKRKQSISLVFSAPTRRGSTIVRRDGPPGVPQPIGGGGLRDVLAKPAAEKESSASDDENHSSDDDDDDTESSSPTSTSTTSTDDDDDDDSGGEKGDDDEALQKRARREVAHRRKKLLHRLDPPRPESEDKRRRREARQQRRQERERENERQTQRRVQELQDRVRALIDRQTREESGDALAGEQQQSGVASAASLAGEYDESLLLQQEGEEGDEHQEEEDPRDFVYAPDEYLRLPRRVLERIMIYFRPPELAVLGLVQKAWQRAADSNSVWRTFFRGTQAQNYSLPSWKRFYKMFWRRNKIAEEILSTEQTYVQSLRAVVEVFVNPLRDPTNKQIITHTDLKGIFSEIEVILGYNAKLFAELAERMQHWHFDICLGDIFAKMSMFLKVYTQYVNHFNKAITIVARLKRTSEDFRAFLMYSQNRKQCKGLDLNAFLIMPVQRIPRYVMLLSDLVKHTHPSHPDYPALSDARTKMQELAVFINIQKKEAENIYEVIAIQDKLIGKFENIVVPGRMYVFEGVMAEIQLAPNSKGKIQKMSNTMRKKSLASPPTERSGNAQISAYKKTDHYAFLFNDMIVLAKKTGLTSLMSFNFMAKKAKKKLMKNEDGQPKDVETFEFETQIALSADCTVSNAPQAIIGTETFAQCFQLFTDDRAWLFAVPTEREKTEWMSVLDKVLLDMAVVGHKSIATRTATATGSVVPSPSSSSSSPAVASAEATPAAAAPESARSSSSPDPPLSALPGVRSPSPPSPSSSTGAAEPAEQASSPPSTATATSTAIHEAGDAGGADGVDTGDQQPTKETPKPPGGDDSTPAAPAAGAAAQAAAAQAAASKEDEGSEEGEAGERGGAKESGKRHSSGGGGGSKTPVPERKGVGMSLRRHSFSMNTLFRKKAKPPASDLQRQASTPAPTAAAAKDSSSEKDEKEARSGLKYLRKRANSTSGRKKSSPAAAAAASEELKESPPSTEGGEEAATTMAPAEGEEEGGGGWDEGMVQELRKKRAQRTSTGTWFKRSLDANNVPILADGIGSSRLKATAMLKRQPDATGEDDHCASPAATTGDASNEDDGTSSTSSDDEGGDVEESNDNCLSSLL